MRRNRFIRTWPDYSIETFKARRTYKDAFQDLKEHKYQWKLLCPLCLAKLAIKTEEEKTTYNFHYKNRQKNLMTTKSGLQMILEWIFPLKEKDKHTKIPLKIITSGKLLKKSLRKQPQNQQNDSSQNTAFSVFKVYFYFSYINICVPACLYVYHAYSFYRGLECISDPPDLESCVLVSRLIQSFGTFSLTANFHSTRRSYAVSVGEKSSVVILSMLQY